MPYAPCLILLAPVFLIAYGRLKVVHFEFKREG